MSFKKVALNVFLAFLFGFSSVWIYNHINVWIGILIFILGLVLGIDYIINKFKNKE